MLPFFEEHDVTMLRILTYRSTEFKGKPEHHEFELYLNLEGIEHRKTQVRHPQSNGTASACTVQCKRNFMQ